jgi:small subunit ribosomal protein S1
MLWSNKKEDETKPEMEGGSGQASLPTDGVPQAPAGDAEPGKSDADVVSDEVLEVSEDNMMALYEASLKDVKEGQVVKGTIIEIRSADVMVDVGYKAEGLIPLKEFPDPKALNVGDIIEVLLESKEDEDGLIVISKEKADRLQGWERIISKYDEGALIQGKPTRKVKGGLMVNVGVEAFLPASLASLRGFCNLDELVGQDITSERNAGYRR